MLLSGGGGTDQIQACGQLANQVRIPYVSPGVTEAGLEGNPWYFASSMSYKQQGPLLAQLVKSRFGGAGGEVGDADLVGQLLAGLDAVRTAAADEDERPGR